MIVVPPSQPENPAVGDMKRPRHRTGQAAVPFTVPPYDTAGGVPGNGAPAIEHIRGVPKAGTVPSTVDSSGTVQAREPRAAEKGFSFWDILDVVNPLHHLPVIGNIYRALSGDEIKGISRILGGGIFGGIIGAVAGLVNAITDQISGKDIGEHIMAFFGIGGDAAPAMALAQQPGEVLPSTGPERPAGTQMPISRQTPLKAFPPPHTNPRPDSSDQTPLPDKVPVIASLHAGTMVDRALKDYQRIGRTAYGISGETGKEQPPKLDLYD